MKTNKFEVEKIKNHVITLSEEKDDLSPFLLFWRRYGKIIQSILLFLSISIFTIGISVSLSQAYKNSTQKHEVIYSVKFNNSNTIGLDNAYPLSDEDAINYYNKKYTDKYGNKYVPNDIELTNNSRNSLKYIITIEDEEPNKTDHLRTNVIRYRTYDGKTEKIGYLSDNIMKTEIKDYKTGKTYIPKNNYVLAEGSLKPGGSINYNLMMWVSGKDTNNNDQAKTFVGMIKVWVDYEKH